VAINGNSMKSGRVWYRTSSNRNYIVVVTKYATNKIVQAFFLDNCTGICVARFGDKDIDDSFVLIFIVSNINR